MRFAIFSSGHAGSNWLAAVLDRRDRGIGVFHEPAHEIAPDLYEQLYALRHIPTPGLVQELARYRDWAAHRQRQFQIVGELHNGLWTFWTRVQELLPERRAMLVRNPIQVVHSLARSLLLAGTPGEKRWACSLAPAHLAQTSEELALFAGACQLWAQQTSLLENLRVEGWYRLEELTTDLDALSAACLRITGVTYDRERLRELQSAHVNRKSRGDNRQENLFWNLWTEPMREAFQQSCGPAMDVFGYRVPARSLAPDKFDDTPMRPRAPEHLPMGPLAPLWVFSSNPQLTPVLVCGVRRYVAVAAALMGAGRVQVLHEDGWDAGNAPPGARVVTLADAAAAGVFIAEPDSAARASRLAALMPHAEIVAMLPSHVPDADFAVLERHARGLQSGEPPHRPAALQAFGPLRCGDRVQGWTVVSLALRQGALQIGLGADDALTAELEVRADSPGGHRSAFPIGEGGVFYRPVSFPWSRLQPACTELAALVGRALGGRSLRAALSEWERATRG